MAARAWNLSVRIETATRIDPSTLDHLARSGPVVVATSSTPPAACSATPP